MSEKNEDRKISEALDLLEELAKRKKADLQELVSSGYANLGELFTTLANDLEGHAKEANEECKETVAGFAARIDTMVRKNPWPYIGGVALGVLVLGTLQGRSRKK